MGLMDSLLPAPPRYYRAQVEDFPTSGPVRDDAERVPKDQETTLGCRNME